MISVVGVGWIGVLFGIYLCFLSVWWLDTLCKAKAVLYCCARRLHVFLTGQTSWNHSGCQSQRRKRCHCWTSCQQLCSPLSMNGPWDGHWPCLSVMWCLSSEHSYGNYERSWLLLRVSLCWPQRGNILVWRWGPPMCLLMALQWTVLSANAPSTTTVMATVLW